MNPDSIPLELSPDDEREIRLTAFIMGELSPDAAAEVRQQLDANSPSSDPQMARLYSRLVRTLELVRETVAAPEQELLASSEAPRLSVARREKLLESFKVIRPQEFTKPSRINWSEWGSLAAMMIGLLAVAGFIIGNHVPDLVRGASSGNYSGSDFVSVDSRVIKEDDGSQSWSKPESSSDRSVLLSSQAPQSTTAMPAAILPEKQELADKLLGEGTERFGRVLRSSTEPATLPVGSHLSDSAADVVPSPSPAPMTSLKSAFGEKSGSTPRGSTLPPDEGSSEVVLPNINTLSAAAKAPSVEIPQDLPNARSTFDGPAAPVITNSAKSSQLSVRSKKGRPAKPTLATSQSRFALPLADQTTASSGGVLAVEIPENGPTLAVVPQAPTENFGLLSPPPPVQENEVRSFGFFDKSAASKDVAGVVELKTQRRAGGRASTTRRDEVELLAALAPTPLTREAGLGITSADSKEPARGEVSDQNRLPLGYSSGLAKLDTLGRDQTGKLPARNGIESGPEDSLSVLKLVSKARAPQEALTSTEGEFTKQKATEDSKDVESPRPATPVAAPQPEVAVADQAFSTFSLNVSDVSFKLAAASLEQDQMPDPATIRSEEFINAFDYRDPEPTGGVPIAFAFERARYPFAHDRDVLRFSVKTAATGRQPGRPLNLVLLLDHSGSMERADRVAILRECLSILAGQLQAQDRVSVVAFARTARLWVDGMPGNQAGERTDRVGALTPEGGTNLELAMTLAYQTARRHYLANGVNRVVLLTDGAANLGDVRPDSLRKMVETQRRQGIALDCFGIGWEGYNDDLLESLSRNGDGRYGFVNSVEDAADRFAGQLAGALNVAASDVKVQVEFNPRRASAYRQIGYAKHQLTKEQFRDNTVDAAEIGAAEAGNALYIVQVNPAGEGPIATVRIRFKVPGTSDYREHEWPVSYTGTAKTLEQANASLQLAASASAFSEWLAASPYAAEVNPDHLLAYLKGVAASTSADPRPLQLLKMIRQAKRLTGK